MAFEGKAQQDGGGVEKSRIAFYPFLFSVFPILSVYSAVASSVSPRELIVPLGLAPILPVVFWALLYLVLRNSHRRGIGVFVAIAAFWCYGYALDSVRELLRYREMLPTGILAALLFAGVALFGILVLGLRRSRRSFAPLTTFLNAAAVIAVTIPCISIFSTYVRAERAADASVVTDGHAEAPAGAPDIVYIVADAYGGHDVLASQYRVDNADFLKALESRGFFVAKESYANYNYTRFSVSSSLGLDYMNGVLEELGGDALPGRVIEDNAAARFLRERGYEFVSFASGYSDTEIEGADDYRKPPRGLSEFDHLLINATPLRSVLNRIHTFRQGRDGRRFGQYDLHRERVRFVLDSLGRLGPNARPRFVFAHIICPHWPYVFDEKGGAVYPRLRFNLSADFPSWEAPTLEEFEAGYANQVLGLNAMLLQTIDAILANNPNTVVLLQGDHGPRSRTVAQEPESWEAYVEEELSILNAIHLPGDEGEGALYDSISPVNSFRVVFNVYLDGGFELLEDRAYFFDEDAGELHDVGALGLE